MSVVHSITRASSFGPLSSNPGALGYPFHHHPPSFEPAHKSLSEPCTPSEPFSFPATPAVNPLAEVAPIPSSSHAPPARGCLKAPTKEFTTKCEPEPESQAAGPSPNRQAPRTRRRPNMKLERIPTNAIARIQMAEGVEPHMMAEQAKSATSSGARGKCKERVPTPYVKSDKSSWLSDNEE